MTNLEPWIRGVDLSVDGRTFTLCFDFAALALAEHALRARGIDVCLLDGLPDIDLSSARLLFASSLQHFQPDCDFRAGLRLVRAQNVREVARKVREAWVASFPERSQDSAPNKAKSKAAQNSQTRGAITPAQRWRELEAAGRINLHIGWDEISRFTPAHWLTLMEAAERRFEREAAVPEVMLAQLTAMVANTGFRSFKSPRQPKEFMPSAWRKEGNRTPAPKIKRRRSTEAITNEAKAVFAFLRRNA